MNNRKPLKCDRVARVVPSNFRLQSLVFFGAIFKTGERKIQWRDDFSRRRIFALRWPDKIESLSCHSFRKNTPTRERLACVASVSCGLGAKNENKSQRLSFFGSFLARPKPVFASLCCETKRKRLLRRLGNASFRISNRPSIPCDAYTE